MVKKLQYFVVLTGVALALISFKEPPKTAGNGVKVVVIDPGHGGKDPGCQGSIHREKDVALAVAL
ncbi:MAG: N-acetylmuramoyl-L-alanine amidase, partial [Bacteroidia bacterium]|nr:N-acetylmuramoyl-L-alanine amidase [Bacteroidia bacterium]